MRRKKLTCGHFTLNRISFYAKQNIILAQPYDDKNAAMFCETS